MSTPQDPQESKPTTPAQLFEAFTLELYPPRQYITQKWEAPDVSFPVLAVGSKNFPESQTAVAKALELWNEAIQMLPNSAVDMLADFLVLEAGGLVVQVSLTADMDHGNICRYDRDQCRLLVTLSEVTAAMEDSTNSPAVILAIVEELAELLMDNARYLFAPCMLSHAWKNPEARPLVRSEVVRFVTQMAKIIG